MPENLLCPFCKINELYVTNTCLKCHNLYWEFEKYLTPEQNDELQMALLKKKPLPDWFEDWWAKMKSLSVFL